ncbi:branched-chain amino acid ABC transporter permease [Desulforhopalus singaporensis]|uniref:Branched-chain amino acid transport system permease protein n=1 Tax=Desulforhopalus singaporensis TaxID=91360 RepID=A0A1H0SBR4_9BACT|nr:branched-chain amino acid ABC transporter permease [Desulforhopalus singaporensis]SDP38949.1 branched-chain amino acid transport system permease protein [Desulforhopalus singaporensis]
MTSTLRKNSIVASGGLLLVILPILVSWSGHDYYISLFSRILIYGLAAVSLDLLLGFSGMISLGHAAYVGIGAYVVAIFFHHASEMEPLFTWPFVLEGSENGLLVLPLAVLISALFALVIGSLCLRTRGMHFIMITLAFAQMLYYFFVSLEKYGGDDGLSLYSRSSIPGMDLGNDIHFYYLCLGSLLVFIFVARRLVYSRFGLIVRGCSNNERRIRALGINSYSYRLALFVIAGAGAGLAGGLLANQTEYVSPGLMHWTLSGELMVMVLLGGLGTLFGPVLGAAVFLLVEENLAMYTEHWMVYMGPFLVLVVIFAKRGLFGLVAGGENGNE